MTAPVRSDPAVVEVALGERGYDIVIGRGLIASLGSRIAALRPCAKAFIVTDENVARHYLAGAEASLAEAGLASGHVIVEPGEASKSYRVFEQVCEAMIASRIERGDLAIALGGGVVGDLAGFAAAVVRRGLDYVQVPTTLLAQVDSSVGGKTAIDSAHGKNLVGAFHQPILVLADTAALDTLPPREFRAGYAEVAKYGLLGDAGFFAWLEANWRDIFAAGISSGSSAREHAIALSCRAKAAIVARDERETGDRALLNLGHTFGHALEAACGFSGRLLHGEAIAAGKDVAPIGFEPGKEAGVTEQSVFGDLGIAGAELARRQCIERRSIGEHQDRLMEGADQILAMRRIDRSLAADRGLDLRQECRWDLDIVEATPHHRSGEAGEIADHAAAQRNCEIATLDTRGDHGLADVLEDAIALRGFARLNDDVT